jgi:hypothetical protein
MKSRNRAAVLFAAVLAVTPLALSGAATITIVNGDAAGVGFNDTTPAVQVGGNTGTTLGEQRLIAFRRPRTSGVRLSPAPSRSGFWRLGKY